MSKAVLISIRPDWCKKILSREKTVEVRKTRPKLETPFKCYIYCTKKFPLISVARRYDYQSEMSKPWFSGYYRKIASNFFLEPINGRVIGEFTCDRVDTIIHIQSAEYFEPVKTCIRDERYFYKPIDDLLHEFCLSLKELESYLQGRTGYGLHISNLEVYDTTVELSKFTALRQTKFGYESIEIKRAPQSWCYVEELYT